MGKVVDCIRMRDNAVTYAKGISIMLMVLGHACYSTYIEGWVNMFDIPCFFFMSGYCFKEKYLSDFKTFTLNKLKGIYWPFVKWTLVFILLHNFLYHLGVYNAEYGFRGAGSVTYSLTDIMQNAKNTVLRLSCSERLLGGYWFLPCLLIGSFIFYAIVKFSELFKERKSLIMCMGGILLIFSVLFNRYELSKWVINYRVLEAGVFILSGYVYKVSKMSLHKEIWFLIASLIFVTLGTFFWQGAAVCVVWQNQVPFMITGICGSIATLGICQMIERINCQRIKNILNFIGENTLTVLTWHFSFFVVVSFLITRIYGLPVLRIGEFPVIVEYSNKGWFAAYFIVAMVGSLFFAYCNKFIKSKWLKL